jgi:flagellar export protein FliJ
MARDTLETLIRLAAADVDEARIKLQALQDVEYRINGDLDALAHEVSREEFHAKADTEMAGSFGIFMIRARAQKETLTDALKQIHADIEAAQSVLAEAFAVQKKYEIIKETRDTKAMTENAHRESLALDELGLNSFRRNQ